MTSKYSKNKKRHTRRSQVSHWCFYRMLTSSLIYDWTNPWQLRGFFYDDSKPKICQWWRHLYICLHQSKPMKILMKFSLFTYQGERKSLRVRQRVRKTLICECFCYGHIIAKKPGVNRRVNFLSILLFEL